MNEKKAKKMKENLKGTIDFLIEAFEIMRDMKKAEYKATIAKAQKLVEEINNEIQS